MILLFGRNWEQGKSKSEIPGLTTLSLISTPKGGPPFRAFGCWLFRSTTELPEMGL